MARSDIKNLYKRLIESEMEFVGSGKKKLEEIYESVKKEYPEFCDDAFLCKQNCSNGHNQPEWQHTVRKSLDQLKRKSDVVSKGHQQGLWIFNF